MSDQHIEAAERAVLEDDRMFALTAIRAWLDSVGLTASRMQAVAGTAIPGRPEREWLEGWADAIRAVQP